ncbi:hypothetical protein [Rhodococcus sovatensis]|uniref:DUF1109 domain-containing protein n=1 Tax=Rhodococcus sovatensis TaxID=1805840 RepID=A0ABZ2PR53_9NOCA
MDNTAFEAVKQLRPPGRVLAITTLVLCVAAIFGSMNYWPHAGRIFDMLNFAILAAVVLAFLIVGIVWCSKTVRFLRSGQPWSWMIAIAPAIVVFGLVLALIIPGPSFERSQPKFDAFVATLPVTGPVRLQNVSIDAFDFKRVTRDPDDTAIYFVDDDTVFFGYISGWIYSPDQPPQPRQSGEDLDYQSLGGPWYRFSLNFNYCLVHRARHQSGSVPSQP